MTGLRVLFVKDPHQVSQRAFHPRLLCQHEVAPMELRVRRGVDDHVVAVVHDSTAL